MRRLHILVSGLASLLFLVPLAASARAAKALSETTARQAITGTVTDALGRPVQGATVELQNSAGKTVAKAQSDAAGRFTFPGIAPGVYAVTASKETFKIATAIVSVSAKGSKPLTLALQSEAAHQHGGGGAAPQQGPQRAVAGDRRQRLSFQPAGDTGFTPGLEHGSE